MKFNKKFNKKSGNTLKKPLTDNAPSDASWIFPLERKPSLEALVVLWRERRGLNALLLEVQGGVALLVLGISSKKRRTLEAELEKCGILKYSLDYSLGLDGLEDA
jgi:hypothetical protein